MNKNKQKFLDLSLQCRNLNELLGTKYHIESGDSRLGWVAAIAEKMPDSTGIKTVTSYMPLDCLSAYIEGMIFVLNNKKLLKL